MSESSFLSLSLYFVDINYSFQRLHALFAENRMQYVCLSVCFMGSPLGLVLRCWMLLGGGVFVVRYFFPSPVGISLSPWRGGCRAGRAGSVIGPLPGNFLFFFENSKQKLDAWSQK